MHHLIPIKEDREYLLRWVATLIAKPEVRITYSVLLTSETHGRGKTTLADVILRPLIGEENTSFPNEEQLLSRFNGWASKKRLAVVNEIHHGRSKKMYDCIKTIVSDASIDIERKGKDSFTTRNWCHVIACSNFLVPLKLPREDRRWLVPKVTEKSWPHEKWAALRAWLDKDGLAIILHWAREYGSYEVEGVHPPMTDRRKDLMDDSEDEWQTLLREILNENDQPKPFKFLYEYFKNQCPNERFKQATVQSILKGRGYKNHGRERIVNVQQTAWSTNSKKGAKCWEVPI